MFLDGGIGQMITGTIRAVGSYDGHNRGDITWPSRGRRFIVDNVRAASAPSGVLDDDTRELAGVPAGMSFTPKRPVILTTAAYEHMRQGEREGLIAIKLD
jgi:hypothetical protein